MLRRSSTKRPRRAVVADQPATPPSPLVRTRGNLPPVLLRQEDRKITVIIALHARADLFGTVSINSAKFLGGRRWFFSSTVMEPHDPAYTFLGAGNANDFAFELELPCEIAVPASAEVQPEQQDDSLAQFEFTVVKVFRCT
jgi:hypothetical protein